MLVEPIGSARVRLEEVVRHLCQQPDLQGPLTSDLIQVFYTLRNYTYFVEQQRQQLDELCQEWGQR